MKRIWLIQKRLESDMTQIELAKKVGVSNQTISNIESGRRSPSGKVANKIANVLGFDMSLFFEKENEIA